MGAIAGEELVQWEKMRAASAREEKIFVLVRLRPLSEKEKAVNEVSEWECINEETVLFRNTLQERSMFPTAYTFDRVFRGDCSTRQVYEEGAKDIALSVVSGINSCIFAYGQTSSGKTYTMVGITEHTVADIYEYMDKHEERAFVLKFSAMEIYNEAVRDLLSTDITPLRILDDPEKGTIIEKLTEEKLRDWNHLKKLLSICEAQRQIGETSLNETSSRSHQIIRLTIESSAREFLGKDKSSTLAASVNFVDLAGSERASQAFSAGQRLKEGCHINRSLLTLGTVIRKLSKGRQGHINYRDSKLTRILQPCLGGNARTAIICTICPARSHVEQSRNTLLFASCAKEVTTNAQVNVVMTDKALVKHLQRELARLESELRTPVPASSACDCAALLRKKDLRIEKLEEENRELKKQRDLAESRVEDLLRVLGSDQPSKLSDVHTWEEDCSTSELSSVAYNHYPHLNFRAYNPEDPYSHLPEASGNRSLSDGDSSPQSIGSKFVKSDPWRGKDTNTREDPIDHCKEVRCVETESPSLSENEEFLAETVPASNEDREEGPTQTGFTYGLLEQNIQDMQRTIQSLVSPYPDESSASGPHENTPPNGVETNFTGRPQSVRRRFPVINYDSDKGSLLRNSSESSVASSIDELKARNTSTSTDEDITSIQTFVEGLKEMAKVHYEKQLVDGQAMELEPNSGKNSKDVGLDPMQDLLESHSDWALEFERQRRVVIELWQSCNVSLVHRTYFFLLFKGDPSDSIYMEVELRRLSFLNQAFSQGNQAVNDGGHTLTLASSMKALRRERETLSKLIYKRFSSEERKRLYEKWGIRLDSKRRRIQLVDDLWSEPKDMNHVKESAVVVAKLVRFFQQGQALKEMFGLSFVHPRTRRRSFGWKQSSGTLL